VRYKLNPYTKDSSIFFLKTLGWIKRWGESDCYNSSSCI